MDSKCGPVGIEIRLTVASKRARKRGVDSKCGPVGIEIKSDMHSKEASA